MMGSWCNVDVLLFGITKLMDRRNPFGPTHKIARLTIKNVRLVVVTVPPGAISYFAVLQSGPTFDLSRGKI